MNKIEKDLLLAYETVEEFKDIYKDFKDFERDKNKPDFFKEIKSDIIADVKDFKISLNLINKKF